MLYSEGLGFRVQGLGPTSRRRGGVLFKRGLRVEGSGCIVSGFRTLLGFKSFGFGFKVSGLSFGFRVWGLGFRV